MDLSLMFSACSGLFFAAGDIAQERESHPDNITLAQDTGRGWLLAATWLIWVARRDVDWNVVDAYVADMVEGQRTYWRSRLRPDTRTPMVEDQLAWCDFMRQMQTEIVNTIRREMLVPK